MRILGVLFLSSIAPLAVAAINLVNLDAPGALEALKRDHPTHYAKVVEAMDQVQAVPYSDKAMHDLSIDIMRPDPTRRQIEASFPAKTRLTVSVENINYQITVLYVKDPAVLVPAK